MAYLPVYDYLGGKSYAAKTFSFATIWDIVLACGLFGSDREDMRYPGNCHNYLETLNTVFDRIPSQEDCSVDQFNDWINTNGENTFFLYEDGYYVSAMLIPEIIAQRCIAFTINKDTTKDFNEAKLIAFQTKSGNQVLVAADLLKNHMSYKFEGVPLIRVLESAVDVPRGFVYREDGKIIRSESMFSYGLPEKRIVAVVEPLSILFGMGRCFVDAITSLVYTTGGNGLPGGVSGGFIQALQHTESSEAMLLYSPFKAVSKTEDPLKMYDFSNVVNGIVYISAEDHDFLSDHSWFLTSRNAEYSNLNYEVDRKTMFEFVSQEKHVVYGLSAYYDWDKKRIFSYKKGDGPFSNERIVSSITVRPLFPSSPANLAGGVTVKVDKIVHESDKKNVKLDATKLSSYFVEL